MTDPTTPADGDRLQRLLGVGDGLVGLRDADVGRSRGAETDVLEAAMRPDVIDLREVTAVTKTAGVIEVAGH